ncbi:uncharacterized protein MONBRDRAFT_35733 [Monosiga brevicollis MX1]|uniref:PDEase domain-containing protein n=1 Tax=Monosiga brevicollis TaxID=81824 RepID=A9UR22_MONBE|nr:uncharacterized protein MONBRDRAFT_35733 [Monosiga brevicollis MX1]EDQ93143.1 predicted protein [Monosiga brevicollis MX1]|eukprot:XP_001742905.1 hypothetical protein [Monosiga brevicollis MX1]
MNSINTGTPEVAAPITMSAKEAAAAAPAIDELSWELNTLALKKDDQAQLAASMLIHAGICDIFRVEEADVHHLVAEVMSKYNETTFHNFAHAVSVMHTLYLLFKDIKGCWEPFEVVTLLIAALCHDIDHQGLSNSYYQNSKKAIGAHYDENILERHHIATTMSILTEGRSVLSVLSEAERARFDDLVEFAILGTDMSFHGTQLKFLQEEYKDGPQDLEALKTDPAKRKKLMQSLLHTADLYNPIKPFDVTREWAIRLQTEFNQQCDLERQEGLPVLPFMDGRGETALAKGETGFISFVAKPWWEAIAAAFPVVKPHLDTITNNVEAWKSLIPTEPDTAK